MDKELERKVFLVEKYEWFDWFGIDIEGGDWVPVGVVRDDDGPVLFERRERAQSEAERLNAEIVPGEGVCFAVRASGLDEEGGSGS